MFILINDVSNKCRVTALVLSFMTSGIQSSFLLQKTSHFYKINRQSVSAKILYIASKHQKIYKSIKHHIICPTSNLLKNINKSTNHAPEISSQSYYIILELILFILVGNTYWNECVCMPLPYIHMNSVYCFTSWEEGDRRD